MKHIIFLIFCIAVAYSLSAQTRSPKRGVSFDFTNDSDLKALQPGTSWFYNWGTTPNNNVANTYSNVYGYEFCPMAWDGNWNSDAIRTYVKAHPDCKYILAFNEPNFNSQANMTPRQAADRWPDLKALAQELGLKIISPACNYSPDIYGSPKQWLDEFFQYVDINDVDGIAIHSYMGWASATKSYVQEYIGYYHKSIWLTEFCAWDNFTQNQGGTALQQRKEMIDMLDFLETEPMVARYAWFIPRRDEYTTPAYPYMELLTNTNGTEKGVLTETGMVWTYMSSYDTTFYHNVDACIEAEHYIGKSAGIYMEQTSDEAGVLDIYGYSDGGELTYNVNIPAAGDYILRLRTLSNADATLNIISASGVITKTVPNTSNVWADRELLLSLDAGKQQLTFKITQGSLKLNYFVITNNGATPTPTPNPPGVEPPVAPSAYACGGTNLFPDISFYAGVPYYAPNWNVSTNYTATWNGEIFTLHLGNATYGDWQAQFPLRCNTQTVTNGKTYFLSFDIESDVDLPRAYMKIDVQDLGDYFLDLPSLSLTAGKRVTVSGLSRSSTGSFNEILFDFGGNPANANITVSNIIICDDYITDVPKMQLTKNISFIQDALNIYIQAENRIATSKLYSIGGQLVSSGVEKVPTAGLTKGIYVLKVKDVTCNIATFKIIVSK